MTMMWSSSSFHSWIVVQIEAAMVEGRAWVLERRLEIV
jgi:hypothetical protein